MYCVFSNIAIVSSPAEHDQPSNIYQPISSKMTLRMANRFRISILYRIVIYSNRAVKVLLKGATNLN